MRYTINEIKKIAQTQEFYGDSNSIISAIKSIDDLDLNLNDLCWCSDKNLAVLEKMNPTNVIISSNAYKLHFQNLNSKFGLFVVDNPRRAFALIMNDVAKSLKEPVVVHSSSIIHSTAKLLGQNINIGPHVVIERDVVIADNVSIGANTTLLARTEIKSGVIIGCNSTIGGTGFGYELNDEKKYEVIPHIGNVIIEENVEIGNNVCIDRAVLGSTRIGKNVKIDNLVHIAHGVQIGENSLIIANAMIAGSCVIGKNVWVSPSVSIMQKINVNDNALIGMGSVVIRDIDANTVVAGVPAKKIKER